MEPEQESPRTAEHARLAEATGRAEDDLFAANPWYEWGPYLSERAWGTVREDYSDDGNAWRYFPHDHARSRAYRWNEDGLAGISDIRHEVCLGLALWNGQDPILKERIFGLAGPEGNHGEDAKEYWWYLEGLPSHALLKWRYHYPQIAFPYDQLVHHGRGAGDPELELLDTGVFDEDRYWSVNVTYAKSSPSTTVMQIVVENHGPEEATLDVLPTLWFRNTWSWDPGAPKPRIVTGRSWPVGARPPVVRLSPGCGTRPRRPSSRGTVLRQRDERASRVRRGADDAIPEGWHQRPRRVGGGHGEPRGLRHQGRVPLPAHRARGRDGGAAAPAAPAVGGRRRSTGDAAWAEGPFDRVLSARTADADEFLASLAPASTTPEEMRVLRQACAGLVWSKQIYPYNVARWLDGDPSPTAPRAGHRHGRNRGWRHLDAFDVLAMPDPWEYPWFAAWDLGFHAIAWAHIDPAFAKYQMLVLLREWFQHPNGSMPAYEWNFDDVNPPVHVMAALRVFLIDGGRDREFLERVFQKLLINYTWWLNRQDPEGDYLFTGGFLGLDNISPIDRSNLPDGVRLEQADGTAWMAFYALSMLVIATELAEKNDVYQDMVIKFLEQFLQIAGALGGQGLWDPEDGFFYDRLVLSSGESAPIKVRTIAGLIPLLPAAGLSAAAAATVDEVDKRFARVRQNWVDAGGSMVGRVREIGGQRTILVSVINPDELKNTLREFFDEDAFLSPYGLRSLSKRYERQPYVLDSVPGATIDYEPAESTTAMFGGNSNWRGPVWFPVNYLAIRQFVRLDQFFGKDVTVEYPTGSGVERTFGEIAQDLTQRMLSIWLPGADGRRPVFGGTARLQEDPAGGTTCSSSSTSTGTTAAGSARCTRPGGPHSSST